MNSVINRHALDIKDQNTHKFVDMDNLWRKCGTTPETVEHVVNCGYMEKLDVDTDRIPEQPREPEVSELTQVQLTRWAVRVRDFCDYVEEG